MTCISGILRYFAGGDKRTTAAPSNERREESKEVGWLESRKVISAIKSHCEKAAQDPKSIEYITFNPQFKEESGVIRAYVELRARNGFGALVKSGFVFYVNNSILIDAIEVQPIQSLLENVKASNRSKQDKIEIEEYVVAEAELESIQESMGELEHQAGDESTKAYLGLARRALLLTGRQAALIERLGKRNGVPAEAFDRIKGEMGERMNQ